VDVPPNLEIPPGLAVVPRTLSWPKRIHRAFIEVANLFDRASRHRARAQFEEKWSRRERESLAVRLASREIQQRYGPTTAFRIATLQFLPKNIDERAKLYQLHTVFETSVNCYRTQLGLPPQDEPVEPAPS
jgi:hypothetical protein